MHTQAHQEEVGGVIPPLYSSITRGRTHKRERADARPL